MLIKIKYMTLLIFCFSCNYVFSKNNVVSHVERIATDTHPVGSSGHQSVANYLEDQLTEMGVNYQIQREFASEKVRSGIVLAEVKNFLVRLKGEAPGNTILFSAHYDSTPNSPGAGDNAIAVAALLEALRWACKNQHRNDLIFLFVDAEELKLLGSKAFVERHPWAKDVDLFFNFEGRGNAGAVYAFETTGNNLNLMGEMKKALPRMEGTSLANDLYALMPNTTDFRHFKRLSQVQGVGFAHIGGPKHYHASSDSPAEVSQQTILDHARNTHALVAYFGSSLLREKGEANAVFFNLPLVGSVVYSQHWNTILLILISALVFLAMVFVFWRKHRVLTGVLLGLILWPCVFISGPLVAVFFWNLSRMSNPHMDDNLAGHAGHATLFFAGLGFLTLALAWVIIRWSVKRIPLTALHLSLMVWWLALGVLSVLYSPGSFYALALPLLAFASVFNWALIRNLPGERFSFVYLMAALPCLLFLFPLCYPIFLALPMSLVVVPGVLIAICLSLFLPNLAMISALNPRLFGVFLTLGLGCMLVGTLLNRPSPIKNPIPESLSYAVDHETGEAFWISSDSEPGEWTKSFLGNAELRDPHFLPGIQRQFLYGPAELQELVAPQVSVLAEESDGKKRRLKVQIQSMIQAENMFLEFASGSRIFSFALGKEELHRVTDPLRIFGIPQSGLVFDVEVAAARDFEFTLVEMKRGLPLTAQRPSHTAPPPWLPFYQDVTLSLRKVVL